MAVKWQLVSRNVSDAVEPPKAKHSEMQTWDADEVAQFLEAAKAPPYHVLFYAALYTGARRSELLGLSWRHVDFLYSQINIERGLHWTKNGGYVFTQPKSAKSRRTIALPSSLVLLLKEHKEKQEYTQLFAGKSLAEDDLVFAHPDGSPLFPNSVSRAWGLIAKKADVKLTTDTRCTPPRCTRAVRSFHHCYHAGCLFPRYTGYSRGRGCPF